MRRTTILFLTALTALAMLSIAGCAPEPEPEQPAAEQPAAEQPPAEEPVAEQPAPEPTAIPDAPADMKDVDELVVEDIKAGDGAEAQPGKVVTVHYTGWLTDETVFDSSLNSGQPFQFRLGQGEVIRGWDEGVAGMKVGGTRILRIPSDMAYGDQGAGGVIPPGATLVFQVDLLAVN